MSEKMLPQNRRIEILETIIMIQKQIDSMRDHQRTIGMELDLIVDTLEGRKND